MDNYWLKGQFLYRNGCDVMLICLVCSTLLHILVFPAIAGDCPPGISAIPLFFVTIVRFIPVYYCLENVSLKKKVWFLPEKVFNLNEPFIIYYFKTESGCAFLIEKTNGPKITDCRSPFEIVSYLIINRKRALLIPFKSEKKTEFLAMLNGYDKMVIVKGGFIKMIFDNV